MLLKDLFPKYCTSDLEISSIEIDSRKVKSGSVFFALKGLTVDGANYIDKAIENGAVAVFCRKGVGNQKAIEVENVSQELILALQKFYSNLPENILAVTGTNGKTSVAYFIFQMQEILGKHAASIGTIGVKTNIDLKDLNLSELTTPDIASLYHNLSLLKEQGINDIAIEASSVGLHQKRMAGIKIGAGAFTNFTVDHLDYHGSMEEYFACKMKLFENLAENSPAIIDADIPQFEQIKAVVKKNNLKLFTYGLKTENADAKIAGDKIIIFGKQ